MDFFEMKIFKIKWLQFIFFTFLISDLVIEGHAAYEPEYIVDDAVSNELRPNIISLDHVRQRRDAPSPPAAPTAASETKTEHTIVSSTTMSAASVSAAVTPVTTNITTPANVTGSPSPATTSNATDINRTTKLAKPSSTPMAVVTQVPVLGANGTGQRWSNLTDTTPKVSDPISADDDFTGVYETPEMIKAERNLSNLIYDNHSFYNSTFVGNHQFFLEHWANISKHPAQPHDMLSNSYRKATTVKLSFLFPFYGSYIQTITVATGGFIYTGEHTHSWIAATQYIAPLMGNFDTSLNNSSRIMLSDDGSKFTAFWENVALLEVPDKLFTFAATLYKNGDIVFAYKNVPIPVQKIDDKSHPVKIGISDAYLTDKIIFYVRRKTVYEYHRVSFKKYEITNGTVLMMTALPTCVQYTTCDTCLNHNTSFQCTWCENIKKCSSGTDRNKQDWQLRNCDNTLVLNATWCPARNATGPALNVSRITGDAYVTDGHANQDADVRTLNTADTESSPHAGAGAGGGATSMKREQVGAGAGAGGGGGGGAVGGAVAACACVALVAAVAAWALYAFRNPHTRSGQLFIKYRPSQWNWRRGEARYTAATIHM